MCCYRGGGSALSRRRHQEGSSRSPSCWVNSFFCCGCFWSTTSKTVHRETITPSPTPFHLWPWKEWRRFCGEKWKKQDYNSLRTGPLALDSTGISRITRPRWYQGQILPTCGFLSNTVQDSVPSDSAVCFCTLFLLTPIRIASYVHLVAFISLSSLTLRLGTLEWERVNSCTSVAVLKKRPPRGQYQMEFFKNVCYFCVSLSLCPLACCCSWLCQM